MFAFFDFLRLVENEKKLKQIKKTFFKKDTQTDTKNKKRAHTVPNENQTNTKQNQNQTKPAQTKTKRKPNKTQKPDRTSPSQPTILSQTETSPNKNPNQTNPAKTVFFVLVICWLIQTLKKWN